MDIEKLRDDLKHHEQEQLLKFWDELDEEKRGRLYDEIRSIDLAKTKSSFQTTFLEAETHKGEKKDPKEN